MPNYRRLHNNFDMGERTDNLSDFELRVWLVYRACADDFGVCPFLPGLLKGKSRRLARVTDRGVKKAMEQLIVVKLCREFIHQGLRYLCQPDWQDREDIRFPKTTTEHPPPPPELLGEFTEKTRNLFREHPVLSRSLPRAGVHETQTLTLAETETVPKTPEKKINPSDGLPVKPYATRPLVEAPAKWSHGQHEGGFCDWMCFPVDLFDQFAKRLERHDGLDPQEARASVRRWAEGVRESGIVATGKMYDFWNAQWELTHGSSKPAEGVAGRQERTSQRLTKFVEEG
jgi:hypothetical protein